MGIYRKELKMNINYDYFKAFYYVATSGSMGKASEIMSLTPPTITKTIQNLEEQLNCQLFVRTSKGVQLTEAGETLLEYVRPGLNLLVAGANEISQLNSLEYGSVKFVMSEAAAHYFALPEVFGAFCKTYPKIRLVIRHMPRKEALNSILLKENDFAILGLSEKEQYRNFNIQEIYPSDNIPIVGKPLKKLAEKPISIEELDRNYPLIFTHAGFSIREYYEDMFRRHGLTFHPNIETPTLDIQLRAIHLGLGYSFVPYPHVKQAIEDGDLYQLKIQGEKDYKRTVCLLTAKDIPVSKAAKALIDIILNESKKNNH